MAAITVDISAQVRELAGVVERACAAVLNAPDDQRAAIVARFAHGTPIERIVAREYYKAIGQEPTMTKRRIRVTNNGQREVYNWSLTDAETDEPITGVRRIEIVADARNIARTLLFVESPDVDLTLDAETLDDSSRDLAVRIADEVEARLYARLDHYVSLLDRRAAREQQAAGVSLAYDPDDIDSIDNAIARLQAERAERMRQ